jgi:hypothetical protein
MQPGIPSFEFIPANLVRARNRSAEKERECGISMIERIVALLLGLSSRAYLNNLLFHGRDDVKDSLQKKKKFGRSFFFT